MVLPERVAAILRCSVPTDRQELRAFLGLTGQFRHLIHKYAELAAPFRAACWSKNSFANSTNPGFAVQLM